MTTAQLGYQVLALKDLHESKKNPRHHFDKAALDELAASIASKGVLTPLLVRPNATGYEIAAGHRRFRAAKQAGLSELPVVVREMTDVEFLEILTIENLQREDVHPLEEAEGYRQLVDAGGYDVARIAERVGKSVAYVYDRLKLLNLTKPAQQYFLEGKIAAGHAVVLARLKPADQTRAIGRGDGTDGGLFERETLLWDPTEKSGGRDTVKPKSVRELQAWVDKHVKFDVAGADPMLFPETVGAVTTAKEEAEKVVLITYDHVVHPDARTDGQRIISPRSWKRADGTGKAKRCEHAITGVVAIGPQRGEAFKVCIAKEKCTAHWATEQRERQARARAATRNSRSGEERAARTAEAERREREREETQRQRWVKARPAILDAVAAAVKKAPTKATGLLGSIIIGAVRSYGEPSADSHVPLGKTAEDLVRHAAFKVLRREASDTWSAPREFPKRAKALGIDVKKILDEVAPTSEPEPEAEPKPATKKPAKRKK